MMFKFERPPLYPHQVEDLSFLAEVPTAALFWEQGLAKSREVVEHVNRSPRIKNVIILTPAQCRNVWDSLDPEDPSEILKYSDRSFNLYAYNKPTRTWKQDGNDVNYITCSLESLVQDKHLHAMLDAAKQSKTNLIVGDESAWFRNPRASRTQAVDKLMHVSRRRIILNGTPIANNEMDLYSQYHALDPGILGYRSFYHFRAHHAIMGGFQNREVVKVTNTETIHRLTGPFTRRRLKKDHLSDLPPKIDLPALEVRLSPSTWKMYREMRDDLVTWLKEQPAMATNGAVKAMRLAQLTSGFLGGLTDDEGNLYDAREVSGEKTDALLDYLDERRANGEGMQIVWVRFQPEIVRLKRQLLERGWDVYEIHGKASKDQRALAKKVFQYGASRPSVLVAHEAAAGVGLTLVAAHEATWLSRDYSYLNYAQASDRPHRGGQKFPVMQRDVVATGPNGEKTVDHTFRKIVRRKEDTANLTSEAWIRLLTEE